LLNFSKSPSSLSKKFDIRVWTERPVHLVEGLLAVFFPSAILRRKS